ncbi:WhiB family transcriptional regulator [Rhodococcus sp. BH5]|uniref:WhiB family transcriptional regulator n=1 Tax=Rhodococcus sp. BH5 TaxID=2871702 RepID=UPI003FA73149
MTNFILETPEGRGRKIVVDCAMAIGKWCQMERECLRYAIKERQQSGIWEGK